MQAVRVEVDVIAGWYVQLHGSLDVTENELGDLLHLVVVRYPITARYRDMIPATAIGDDHSQGLRVRHTGNPEDAISVIAMGPVKADFFLAESVLG